MFNPSTSYLLKKVDDNWGVKSSTSVVHWQLLPPMLLNASSFCWTILKYRYLFVTTVLDRYSLFFLLSQKIWSTKAKSVKLVNDGKPARIRWFPNFKHFPAQLWRRVSVEKLLETNDGILAAQKVLQSRENNSLAFFFIDSGFKIWSWVNLEASRCKIRKVSHKNTSKVLRNLHLLYPSFSKFTEHLLWAFTRLKLTHYFLTFVRDILIKNYSSGRHYNLLASKHGGKSLRK